MFAEKDLLLAYPMTLQTVLIDLHLLIKNGSIIIKFVTTLDLILKISRTLSNKQKLILLEGPYYLIQATFLIGKDG